MYLLGFRLNLQTENAIAADVQEQEYPGAPVAHLKVCKDFIPLI